MFFLFCFTPDYSLAGLEISETDGMWYYYGYRKRQWAGAKNDCKNSHIGSTLPVLKTEAQMQLAFDYFIGMDYIYFQLLFNYET